MMLWLYGSDSFMFMCPAGMYWTTMAVWQWRGKAVGTEVGK